MRKKKRQNVLSYIALIVIGVAFLVPILWLVLASFDTGASTALSMPEKFSLENYRMILSNQLNLKGFLNSLIISVVQVAVVLVCSLLTAYPLSRFHLRRGQQITQGLLFMTSLPVSALLVPVYHLFIALKLIDSQLGVIIFLSASALPYGIWMMKNFLDGVDVGLEEAAWIDGASKVISLTRVVLPLMLPGIFTVAMFTFVGSWGNFYVPFILLQSTEKMPASVNIYRFFGEHGAVIYGQLAAYSIMYMLPVFVLYFCSQKYMSKGFIMSGATKG